MNIIKYIDRINDLYGNEPVPRRFDTAQWLRPGFRGAGLVEQGLAGVRQGYGFKTVPKKPRLVPTAEQERIAKEVYKKSFNELTNDQMNKIRQERTTGYHSRSQIAEKTKKNIIKLWNTKKGEKYIYRNMFLNGTYPTLEQLPKWLPPGQAGTAVHRIGEFLNGRKVEKFDHPIKVNKKAVSP